MMTDSPRRRLTSVYDLENQVGTVESRLKFPGTCPVYCHKTARFPFKNRHRSKNDIGSHQRRSRTCNSIVIIYPRLTTRDLQLAMCKTISTYLITRTLS